MHCVTAKIGGALAHAKPLSEKNVGLRFMMTEIFIKFICNII